MTAQYAPDHAVTVYSVATRSEYDLTTEVVSINTQKTYGGPGVFQIELVMRPQARHGGKTWNDILKTNDVVFIDLNRGASGDTLQRICVGLISRVSEVLRFAGGGKPQLRCTIQGVDLLKILQKHQVGWESAIAAGHFGSEKVIYKNGKYFFAGTPSDLIGNLIEANLFQQVPWTRQFISLSLSKEDRWGCAGMALAPRQGSLWEILQAYANRPWNMLHGDVDDKGQFQLILEAMPIDLETGLTTRESLKAVIDDDVVGHDLGKSDDHRVTYSMVQPMLTLNNDPRGTVLLAKEGGVQYDTTQMAAHGFIPMYIDTPFFPGWSAGAEASVTYQNPVPVSSLQEASIRGQGVWAMNFNNHNLITGSVTIHGNPFYRAGDAVVYGGREFLVEGVTHDYSYPNLYRTTIQLSRGQPLSGGQKPQFIQIGAAVPDALPTA